MCLSLAIILFSVFSVSSYWFDVPKSLYRVLVIYPFSRPLVVLSFTVFYSCSLTYFSCPLH